MIKVFSLLFILNLLYSATISGEIYNGDNYSHMENVRIRLDGPISVQQIAHENYSISIPAGEYNLTASYFENGVLQYTAQEKVNVNQQQVRYDLVLLPAELQELSPKFSDIKRNEQNTNTSLDIESPQIIAKDDLILLLLGMVLLGIFGVIIADLYLIYRPFKKPDKEPANEYIEKTIEQPTVMEERQLSENDIPLDNESLQILTILKTNGGRILQKELRDILKASESTMSLTLSELENRGYIKRFKKGRENLVKCLKEPPNSQA